MRNWRNPRNLFYILRIHYTADPAKRDPAWAQSQRPSYSLRAWKREYEIDWTAPEGEPVVPEFDAGRHARVLAPVRDRRLLRWWDFGFNAPVCLFVQLSLEGQVRVLRELCPFNTPLDAFWEMVQAMSRDLVVRGDHFDAGDPTGMSSGILGNVVTWLGERGVQMHVPPHTGATGAHRDNPSYALLRQRFLASILVARQGLEPSILIDPVGCPNLIEALSGAFHLSDKPPYRPVKAHPFKDVVDALRYGLDCLSQIGSERDAVLKRLAAGDRLW